MVDSIWFKSPYIKWPALKTQDEFDEHATKMVKFWLGHNAHERFGYKINFEYNLYLMIGAVVMVYLAMIVYVFKAFSLSKIFT